MKRKWILIVIALLFCLPSLAERIEEQRCKVAADPQVEITNVSGSIDISPWDHNEVYVHGRLGKNVTRMDFRCTEGRVAIEVIAPKKSKKDSQAHLRVNMPAGARLTVNAVSADTTVSGITGEQILRTVSGDIGMECDCPKATLESVSGNMVLSVNTPALQGNSISGDITLNGDAENLSLVTVSGNITVNGGSINCTASTISGDIRLKGSTGAFDAETVSGDIKAGSVLKECGISTISGDVAITGAEPVSLDIETISGEISYKGGLAPRAAADLKSNSGSVTLELSPATPLNIEAESLSGDIQSIAGAVQRKREHGPGRVLSHQSAPDAPTVDILTKSGEITIR